MTYDGVYYRNASLSEVNMFYREAGDPSHPTVLLLHGFPTSSHMFRGLIPLLACFLHVVAPDYPGFGYTESPPADKFDYTFDHLANTVEELIQELGIKHFYVYIMDYGAPVGLRLMEAHPERILGLIVQNGIAHEVGLAPFWDPIRKSVHHPLCTRSQCDKCTP
jgi:pimeloyl-ACP methyl ester carboxylesterase